MNERNVNILKMIRLIISVCMVVSVLIEYMNADFLMFPIEQIMAALFGLFASTLGLQYRIEGKDRTLSLFLMLFGLIIVVMTFVGSNV